MNSIEPDLLIEDDFWSAERADADQQRWLEWHAEQVQRAARAGNRDFSSRFIPGHRAAASPSPVSMRMFLSIPRSLIVYAQWHAVEPEEYAQFILDEKAREVSFWLIEEARAYERRERTRRPAVQGLS